jgi:hypothetical protein
VREGGRKKERQRCIADCDRVRETESEREPERQGDKESGVEVLGRTVPNPFRGRMRDDIAGHVL